MKILILISLLLFSIKAHATGCMATVVKGTQPGYSKPALVSALGASAAAFALSQESDNLTEDQDSLISGTYLISGLYLFASSVMRCRSIPIEEYNKLKKDGIESGLGHSRRYIAPPSKAELEERVKNWRRISRFTVGIVGGLNLSSLYSIHKEANKSSTKTIALAAGILTIVTAIYDYDKTFSDDTPPWANFDIVTSVDKDKVYPSVSYTYSF